MLNPLEDSKMNNIIGSIISEPGLYEIAISKGCLSKSQQRLNSFIENLDNLERRFQGFYVDYCLNNDLKQTMNEWKISIKGFFVQHVSPTDFSSIESKDIVVSLYVEMSPATNKDFVKGFYHWEEKINGL